MRVESCNGGLSDSRDTCTKHYVYRLDDESRQLRDLERRGNRCIDILSAQREGVCFGFQGVLNLVVAEDLIVV